MPWRLEAKRIRAAHQMGSPKCTPGSQDGLNTKKGDELFKGLAAHRRQSSRPSGSTALSAQDLYAPLGSRSFKALNSFGGFSSGHSADKNADIDTMYSLSQRGSEFLATCSFEEAVRKRAALPLALWCG